MRAKVLNEAAMVERTALRTAGIRDMYGLAGVEDCVTMHGDGIDAVKTCAETERPQRGNACRLKKLANNTIRLGERAFEEGDAEGRGARCLSCGRESVCEGGACYARANDDDVI